MIIHPGKKGLSVAYQLSEFLLINCRSFYTKESSRNNTVFFVDLLELFLSVDALFSMEFGPKLEVATHISH